MYDNSTTVWWNLASIQEQSASWERILHESCKDMSISNIKARGGEGATIWDCRRRPRSSDIDLNLCPIFDFITSQYRVLGDSNGSYIRPSIAHETIRVPSWLNATEVTGSECAGRTLSVFPAMGVRKARCMDVTTDRTSSHIPDAYCFVKASGYKQIRVRIIVDTKHKARMALQTPYFGSL